MIIQDLPEFVHNNNIPKKSSNFEIQRAKSENAPKLDGPADRSRAQRLFD